MLVVLTLVVGVVLALHATDAEAIRRWRIPERPALAVGFLFVVVGGALLLLNHDSASASRQFAGGCVLALGVVAIGGGEIARYRRRRQQ
jgi:hypothetical protein